MSEPVIHSVEVADKYSFLRALMLTFSDRGRMSLEGNLSKCHFPSSCVVSKKRIGVLRRSTLFPRQQFVVLGLEEGAIDEVLVQVRAAGVNIEDNGIIHVLIERDGVLQLGAYDSFGEGCVVTGPAVSAGLLADLQASGIARSFEIVDYKGDWPGLEGTSV